jgi:predicted nucleic acid-binding protein
MDYLIDSDVFTDYLGSNGTAIAWVESLIPAGFAISSVAYMETLQGALRSANPAALARHAESLAQTPILPFTEETARLCGHLRHELWSQGKRVRPRALDLMIAATALEHGLTLVTRNRSDYQDIPALSMADEPY